MKRYHYVSVPIDESVARAGRDAEIQHLKDQIAELEAEPLVLEGRKLVEVLPGEPGYDTAELESSFVFYRQFDELAQAEKEKLLNFGASIYRRCFVRSLPNPRGGRTLILIFLWLLIALVWYAMIRHFPFRP